MRAFPKTIRHWVVVAFAAVGIGLLPWTVWLSESLKPHHVTNRWDLAWSGFDTGLAILFILTAVAAHRRSTWIAPLAVATGTVLVVDAWFDVVLESHADELRNSIMLAVFAELPAAAVCFWVGYRAERVISHLAAAGQRATERDLVGVLQVAADREAAGEPRDSDPAP
ncbi:MAG TPA: hypothetical protein VGH52_01825 [Gaiellaceae bacterium]